MKLLAWDSETYLVPARTSIPVGASTVLTSRYVTPKLVLGSVATEEGSCVLGPAALRSRLAAALESEDTHIIAHHLPFDLDVVTTAFPELAQPFLTALDQGRCHDTKQLDLLLRLGRGVFDKPTPPSWGFPEVKVRTLDDLSQEYLGKVCPKDLRDEQGDLVRLSFHKWDGVPIEQLPQIYYQYALQDAEVTLACWKKMIEANDQLVFDCLRAEAAQTRAEVAMYAFDKIGLRIDRAEAQRLRDLFAKDVPGLQAKLVETGLGEWLPLKGTIKKVRIDEVKRTETLEGEEVKDTGWLLWEGGELRREKLFKNHWVLTTARPAFHLYQNEVRVRLRELAAERGIAFKRTNGGDISITAEDWAEHVPAEREDLQAWLAHEKLKKILGTYLNLYSAVDEIFPKVRAVAARSTRSSYASPNVQNIPKRKHGIRSVFIPHAGFQFVVADYSFQELVTLAQAMCDLGIKGPLFTAIQNGDPHTSTAAMLLRKDPKDVTKAERQAAKALNFGAPGGLGAVKLADYARKQYGVNWTLDQAREVKKQFLEVYPDIQEFLNRHATDMAAAMLRASGRPLSYWKRRFNVKSIKDLRDRMLNGEDDNTRRIWYRAERSLTVRLRTGVTRHGCSYTEGANTEFQGLAACVTKEALWLLHRALYGNPNVRTVLVVHDEIVLEAVPERQSEAAALLESCMLEAFRRICPDTGCFAKVEVKTNLTRWGAATSKEGVVV